MKKILLILLVAISSSVSIVSCSEEVITPSDENSTPSPAPPSSKL